jgi:uncharacterized protein (TIGR02246 family)
MLTEGDIMAGTESGNDNAHVKEIHRIAESFFEAWNQRNVQAIVSNFSDNAEVVNSLGLWWRGSAEVTKGLGAMNAIGPSLKPYSISVHLVTPDAALCIVAYTVASFTRPDGQQMAEQRAISMFFMVNQVQRWRIAGAQTTAVNAEVIAQLQSRGLSGA